MFVTLSLTLILVGLIGGFSDSGFFSLVLIPFIALFVLVFQKHASKQHSLIGVLIKLKQVEKELKDEIRSRTTDMVKNVRDLHTSLGNIQEQVTQVSEKHRDLNTRVTMGGIVKK